MPRLTFDAVIFYSQADETGFFAALKAIKTFRSVVGVRDKLIISFPSRLSECDLRDLIGVLYRFDLDMTQLMQFKNSRNEKWFYDPHAYWFSRVWGKPHDYSLN